MNFKTLSDLNRGVGAGEGINNSFEVLLCPSGKRAVFIFKTGLFPFGIDGSMLSVFDFTLYAKAKKEDVFFSKGLFFSFGRDG